MNKSNVSFITLVCIAALALAACSSQNAAQEEAQPAAAGSSSGDPTQPAQEEAARLEAEAGLYPEVYSEQDGRYGIYLSLSQDDNAPCNFGDASGCRIYYVEAELKNGQFIPDPASVVTGFYDGGAFQLALSPDQTMLAFKGVGANNSASGMHILNLQTRAATMLDPSGSWPTWVSNNQVLFTTAPTSGRRESLKDFMIVTLDGSNVTVTPALGAAGALCGEWNGCGFEDGFVVGDWLAFHSETSNQPDTFGCPLVDYVPTEQRGKDYGPQPAVVSLSASQATQTVAEGVNYFQFDLAGANINACAHFAGFGNYLVCTEQNTQEEPFRVCSDPQVSLQDCQSMGNSVILYNRLFGWALDEATGQFVSMRGEEPLFDHLHPAQLPDAQSYWDMAAEGCQVYKTKQAPLLNNVVLANVYCQSQGDPNGQSGDETHLTAFSRIFLVDIANPDKPQYFDLTGWFEDNFPEWSDGNASGYTSAFFEIQP